jgi:hypothetical protein
MFCFRARLKAPVYSPVTQILNAECERNPSSRRGFSKGHILHNTPTGSIEEKNSFLTH